MSKNLVVRFAGEGGQGVVGGAELMASAAASGGYHVLTFSTFPSQIKGGPAWGQARISSEPILTPGDYLDVLVAQNQYAYDHNLEDLREGGLVVYNSEEFEVLDNARALGIPADRMAREAGNPLASTIILIGAVAKMAGVSIEALESFIRKRWSRGRAGDEQIIEGNINALRMGVEVAEKAGLALEDLEPAPVHNEPRVLIRGYEAAALGAMAGGLDAFIGYPISPATTMLVYMESNLVGNDKFVGQASSEIEAINSLVGVGFAGKKIMTSTAGPGVSLMGEGLGLAWMAEIPVVVVDVQRGGPATGLPTKTEQSDFTMAVNPGHGDMTVPVIACGSTDEAFWASMYALNWAERYQGPVIMLSEASIAERAQDVPMFDLSKVVDERRVVSQGEQGNRRYAGDGVSPFPVPGGAGAYVANASEHDEQGDTTHLPDIHVTMTERRFKKLDVLDDGTFEAENTGADVIVMPWGGSKGSALAAWRELREEGVNVGWVYTMFLNPLPPGLLEELQGKRVLVPELNYLGQFATYLRAKGVNAEAITQYTGLPFKVADLKAEVKRRMQA